MVVSNEISLIDGMSPVMKNVIASLKGVIGLMHDVSKASASDFAKAEMAVQDAAAAMDKYEKETAEAKNKQNQLNNSLGKGQAAFGGLLGSVTGLIAGYVGLQGVMKLKDFALGSLAESDISTRAETQLAVVMSNIGSTKKEFESVKKTASELQNKTMFDDDALLGGAGELATYVTDVKALNKLMPVLADYASGMTGGAEVDYQQMIDLATGLGKAMDGTYDSLKKKGFDVSGLEMLKNMEENGKKVTDMMKVDALKETISTWKGLSETIAKTPNGQVVQLKNLIGNIREDVGKYLYPAVIKLVQSIKKHLPEIKTAMMTLGSVIKKIIDIVDFFVRHLDGVIVAMKVIGAATAVTSAILLFAYVPALSAATKAALKLAAANFLAMSPILLAILAVIALAAILTLAFNKLAGASFSFFGMLCGLVAEFIALIYDAFALIANAVLSVLDWIVDHVIDTKELIYNAFHGGFTGWISSARQLIGKLIGDTMSLMNPLIAAFDKITGSHLSEGFIGITDKVSKFVSGNGEKKQDYVSFQNEKGRFSKHKFDLMNPQDAFEVGYNFGDEIQKKLGDFDLSKMLDPLGNLFDEIANNTKDTAKNTEKFKLDERGLALLTEYAKNEWNRTYNTMRNSTKISFNGPIHQSTDVRAIAKEVEGMMLDSYSSLVGA